MGDKMRILTSMGPVELRGGTQTRPLQDMQVKGVGKLTIHGKGKEGWLKVSNDTEEKNYHLAVKQAMMIGAKQMAMLDATDPQSSSAPPGVDKQQIAAAYQAEIKTLVDGQEVIRVGGHKVQKLNMMKRTEEKKRDIFVKFSKRCMCSTCCCCHRRERLYIMEDGKFIVYKSAQKSAKINGMPYSLKDAKLMREEKKPGTDPYPPFDDGYVERLRVDFKERLDAKKGSIFMYPQDKTQMKDWMRTFRLSRQLTLANDRRAMKVAIGRAVSVHLNVGWKLLSDYFKELDSTKKLVKQMALRLMKVDVAKGWNKMKLIHQIEKDALQMKEGQRIFAARYMSEKLGKLGAQDAMGAGEVRETVVSRIQNKFRQYRDEKIFERQYLIGANNMSRLRTARSGVMTEIGWDSRGCESVLKTVLDAKSRKVFDEAPAILKTANPAYSHVEWHTQGKMLLSVSDNGQSLVFANPDPAGRKHLNKVDLSNYVNLDRISNIVLNTEPQKNVKALDKADRGCWLTINGPRVCWGKRTIEVEEVETKKELVQVLPDPSLDVDAFAVPKAISEPIASSEIMMMKCKVAVGGCDWDLTDPKDKGKDKKPQPVEEPDYNVVGRKLYLHVMGYRFAAYVPGENKNFSMSPPPMVTIPVPKVFDPSKKDKTGDACTVGLDTSVIAAEVVEVREPKNKGNLSSRSSQSGPQGVPRQEVQLVTGSESLLSIYNLHESSEGSTSATYTSSVNYSLPLFMPDGLDTDPSCGSISLQISMTKTADNLKEREKMPISPELAGGGVPLTFYTSHRGSWYDASLQEGQFSLQHVANFVELKLLTFRLPEKVKDKGHPVYRVRASIGGVSVLSPPMHRSAEEWQQILGPECGDPNIIDFSGSKLCIPLPPGYYSNRLDRASYANLPDTELRNLCKELESKDHEWGNMWNLYCKYHDAKGDMSKQDMNFLIAFLDHYSVAQRPKLKVEILKSDMHSLFTPVTYSQFVSGGLKSSKASMEVSYHADLEFQYMLVDQVQNVSVFMGDKAVKTPPLTHVEANKSEVETATIMNVEFALRDRETVKGSLIKPGEHRTLCVGDSALLYTEEPLTYPQSKEQARRRYVKSFKENLKDWPEWNKMKRGAELRPPALSSEWSDSRLADAVPKISFKQSVIPNYCPRSDILPHRFMLPNSEYEFYTRQCQGIWPYIVNDLCKVDSSGKNKGVAATMAKSHIVTHLSHTFRKVPVHVIAMYNDGYCDLEVTPNFMAEWKLQAQQKKDKAPEPSYCLPGVAEKIPKTKGKQERIILKQVPTMLLHSAQTMSFSVYDAAYSSFKDMQDEKPDITKEDLPPQPKDVTHFAQYQSRVAGLLKNEYRVPAGPLPPDASPGACQYEWSLHVRCGSESEMNHLVSMLRQCMRLDSFKQAQAMAEYSARTVGEMAMPSQFLKQLRGGQLEVVLVEARHLEPVGLESRLDEYKKSIPFFFEKDRQGTIHEDALKDIKAVTAGGHSKCTPEGAEITVEVNFRMTYDGKPVAFKNSTVQQSVQVEGGNPSWAALENCKATGGFVFKTGQIDPERYRDPSDRDKDLKLEFEVLQKSITKMESLGTISLGFWSNNLIDPKAQLKNLWLPLESAEGKEATMNKSGEIHIMTRWLTADKLHLAPGQQSMTMRSTFLKSIWSKVIAQRVKEPIYSLEAHYLHYNPNLVRGAEQAESPPDYHRRHLETLINTEKYLECVESRQEGMWRKWEKEMEDEGHTVVDVGALIQMWKGHLASGGHLTHLEELIHSGIPAGRRETVWLQLTGAVASMSSDAESMPEAQQAGLNTYKSKLQTGIPQRSDANTQLQEDAFHLASWESASPPVREAVDFHLRRLRRAQNVCTALIAMEDAKVAYCESLLVIAFYMLLPKSSGMNPDDDETCMLSESSVFWLIYTLVGDGNGAFKEYYGKPTSQQLHDVSSYKEGAMDRALNTTLGPEEGNTPRDGAYESGPSGSTSQPLCVASGAMDDVAMLDCILSVYEPELWKKLHAIGFQLATVFYGCFMRLYATFMPTATVFRFWDLLMYGTGDRQAQPNQRVYLLDLAFGILKSKASDLKECQSALEVRSLILGVMGSLYDMSTVIEITLDAHTYIWGVENTTWANKVASHLTEREDMFRMANEAIVEQNEVLKILTRDENLGNIPQTKYVSPVESKGVATKELLKDVLPVMQQGFGNIRTRGLGQQQDSFARFWTMHRPMPLVAKSWSEGTVAKSYNFIKSSITQVINQGETDEAWPVPSGPPTLLAQSSNNEMMRKMKQAMDPLDFNLMDLKTVLEKDVPNWGRYAQKIWAAFTNRRDKHRKWRGGLAGRLAGEDQNIDPENSLYNSPGGGLEPIDDGLRRPPDTKPGWNNMFGWLSDPQKDAELRRRQASGQIERISLNEFYIALIICSRGTLGEKASALFDRYSYDASDNTDIGNLKHNVPVSIVGKSLLKSSEDSIVGLRNLYPPEDGMQKDNALHLQVLSNYPTKKTVVGDVYIPKLAPFMHVDPNDAETVTFNIWGKPPAMSAMARQQEKGGAGGAGGGRSSGFGGYGEDQGMSARVGGKLLVCVGEMELAISWTPKNPTQKEIGQLCLRLKSIRFFPMYTTGPSLKNPWVTVHTYDKNGQETAINRWDPRSIFANVNASETKRSSLFGSSGGNRGTIEFPQTMSESWIGSSENPSLKNNGPTGTGWNSLGGGDVGEWVWEEKYGKQFSTTETAMDEKFLGASRNTKKNVMDLLGVRLIVTGILNRSMLNITNRQAILIADSLFNRQGATPGIIEAVLMSGKFDFYKPHKSTDRTVEAKVSLAELKEKAGKSSWTDVTEIVLLEQEKQAHFDGTLNMFKKEYLRNTHPEGITLADIGSGIRDPYRMSEKMLWIRYVRSGDGQRCTQGVKFQMSGKIHAYQDPESPEVKIDLLDAFPQTKVTKEEFVSCLLTSPLLGESMRRIGSTDHVLHQKQAIPLDVTIMDPHHDDETEQFMDAVNIQQSVLLEVWDADIVKSDFLGEAWLPPLSTLTSTEKDYVLMLQPADNSDTAEPFPTRKDQRKVDVEHNAGEKDQNRVIKGELHVTLAWKYPMWVEMSKDDKDKLQRLMDKGSQEDSLKARARMQKLLHTGELTVKINRGHHLRRADAAKGGACDAFVTMWVRNDAKGEFREEHEAKTPTIKNNRDPVWKNQFKEPFELQTGSFEIRYPELETGLAEKLKNAFKGGTTKRHEDEDRALQAVKSRFGAEGLKLKFFETPQAGGGGGEGKSTDGEHHNVEVFLGDTVREFKSKVTEACKRESDYWRKQGATGASKASLYTDVNIGYKHLVMVFQPPQKLLQLAAQKLMDQPEYQHSYTLAIQDPSSWQPLDPTRTFGQYPQYGFGRKQEKQPLEQRLRIVEETEGYKMLNLRYKEFARDREKPDWKDKNSKDECYGWAKFPHPMDGTSEWRPAMLKPAGTAEQRKKDDPTDWAYEVNWCFPSFNITSEKATALKLKSIENGQRQVMLQPRYPLFEEIDPLHQKILAQNGKTLRQMGKSDWEIQESLQKNLDDLCASLKRQGELKRNVPPITVDIIRHFLR